MSMTTCTSTSLWNCQLLVSSIHKSLFLPLLTVFQRHSVRCPSPLFHWNCYCSFQGPRSLPRCEILWGRVCLRPPWSVSCYSSLSSLTLSSCLLAPCSCLLSRWWLGSLLGCFLIFCWPKTIRVSKAGPDLLSLSLHSLSRWPHPSCGFSSVCVSQTPRLLSLVLASPWIPDSCPLTCLLFLLTWLKASLIPPLAAHLPLWSSPS